MRIVIHGMHDFSEAEKEKIKKALEFGEIVLNSEQFKKRVLATRFSETRGLSSAQIYEVLMQGGDTQPDGSAPRDGEIDITMHGYFESSTVIGWTTLKGIKQYFNKRFLRQFTPAEVFGHVLHETLHRLNFRHSWRKKESVPYKLGYLGRDLYNSLLSSQSTELFASEKTNRAECEKRVEFVFA